MKGTFSLNVHDMGILYGNLGIDSGDTDLYHVTDLSFQRSGFGFLIAHDTIDHSIAHRTKKYVTVAEEIRALGAALFVRAIDFVDPSYDLINQLQHLNYDICDLKFPSKRDMGIDYSEFLYENIECDSAIDRKILTDWCNAQLNYGYWQKHDQYSGNMDQARCDFDFISRNSEKAAELLKDRYWDNMECSGITCTFDTIKHIFNTRFKWT